MQSNSSSVFRSKARPLYTMVGRTVLPSARAEGALFEGGETAKTVRLTRSRPSGIAASAWSPDRSRSIANP